MIGGCPLIFSIHSFVLKRKTTQQQDLPSVYNQYILHMYSYAHREARRRTNFCIGLFFYTYPEKKASPTPPWWGSNNGTAVLVTGAALLAASLGLGYMTYASTADETTTKPDERGIEDIDDDDAVEDAEAEFITERDVCQVFEKLFMVLQQTFGNLMSQVQQLQMAGQMIPEAQLQGLIRQELERALMAKQGAILEAAGMDADCLEEAVWEFIREENPKVKAAVERFQKVWQNATGEQVVGWRPDGMVSGSAPEEETLEAERTIQVAGVYFSALTQCMKDLVEQYKSAGKDLKNAEIQQDLNLEFAKSANEAGEAALGRLGVTQNQFEASVKAHANDPNVGRALGLLQMQQQRDLMALQAS